MRRSAVVGAVALASGASGLLGIPAASAAGSCIAGFSDQGGGLCSRDLVVTRSVVAVTVPAGVTSMTFDARGAEGGSSSELWNGQPSPGGKGGRVVATVPVTAGDRLQLVVGEAGGQGAAGGWGGGGSAASNEGGRGGGGTFVFDGQGNALVAAGGGGGGGFDYNVDVIYGTGTQQAPGGSGAGLGTAGDGHAVAFRYDPTYNAPTHFAPGGGHGATASGAGAGGHSLITSNYVFGQVDGSSGQGPAAGPLPTSPSQDELGLYLGAGGASPHGTCCYYTGFGGGGGGGYYGGGSGSTIDADLEGGGGGGGTGFVAAGATSVSSSTGSQAGDGSLTVSYTVGTGGGGGGGSGSFTSFSPSLGGVGTKVTLLGTNLGRASSVSFGSTAATSFSSTAGTKVVAKVPAGATSGKITVLTSTGTFTTASDFTFVAAPTISSLSPLAAAPGMTVSLSGTNLDAVTSVKVGNKVVAPDATTATSLSVTIPAAAASGKAITVASPGGTATSAQKLVVVPVPVVSTMSRSSGPVGTVVTIVGSGLGAATAVTIGDLPATFSTKGSSKVIVTIPPGAVTGSISITTPGGLAASPVFTVL